MRPEFPTPNTAAWAVTTLVIVVVTLLSLCPGCERKPRAHPLDFSASNTVSIALGDPRTEYGTGLDHIYFENDGLTTTTNLDGVACRYLKLDSGEFGYFYFAINRTFKKANARNVRIDVEYLDPNRGSMVLHYDSSDSKGVENPAYAEAKPKILLHGSKSWHTATFHVENATFKNAQNSHSDFRLCVSPPELFVRRVTITREGN